MIFFKTIHSFFLDKEYRQLFFTTLIILSIGTVAYRYLEGWNWIDSLYFSVITLTTVGYGDISPETNAGKLFTIIYIFVGIGIILSFVDTIHNHYKDLQKNQNKYN